MPTTAIPRGRTIDVLLKEQSAFGSLPTGNWIRSFIYSHGLEEKQPFQDDPLLGIARTNDRDMSAPSPGLATMTGPIVAPLDFNHLGLWLKMFFGAAQVTGSADPYTHVFTSGAEALPYMAMEIALKNVGGATKYMQYLGLIGSRLTIEATHGPGNQRISMDMMGRSETKAGASGGGTPAAAWDLSPAAVSIGKLKIDGADAANITKVSATYDNKVAPQDFLNGTKYPSGFELLDEATFGGSLDLRFLDADIYDLAVAGDPVPVEIIFELSADRSLSLLAPAVRFDRSGIPINGPGGIQQSVGFRAEQSAEAAMLTPTLKSLVASY